MTTTTTMTLAAIRSMFAPGQVWEAENTYAAHGTGERTLVEKKATQFIWRTEKNPRFFMPFPPKKDILEASPGFLKFKIAGRDGTLALRLKQGVA